jgi:uncharacterized protein YndB with AHSA1/START domain
MLTLEIGRVLRARPSFVFGAFSDADELAKWWGPRGFSTPSLDVHVSKPAEAHHGTTP